ncbi:O-antigen ligase family protein [Pseudomonas phytophila]|uniref:O-antigen ligase family protein n=1 Tax=Pseudomonas phytophila TaxID=2867264 RepID=A0ABY6FC03_9PSED|nr:O-antigen ligase family protein [Pseudomonas phytophila]UXZ95413.1 O-antigen ligase family protein [Pseudomonas phytophila]
MPKTQWFYPDHHYGSPSDGREQAHEQCEEVYMVAAVSRFFLYLLVAGFTVHISGMLYISDGSRFTTISNLTLFLPALILLFLDREVRESLCSKRYLPLLVLLGFTVLVALLNPTSDLSASDQLKTGFYILLYVCAIKILVDKNLMEKSLDAAFLIAGIFALVSLIYTFFAVDSNMFLDGQRIQKLGYKDYADFKNPIIAALYYGFFGVYGVHQLLTKRYSRFVALVYGVCVLALSLYLYCTLSRGVWLGYGAAIGASIAFHNDERSRKWLAGAAVAGVLVLLWLSPMLLEQTDRGFSYRDLIWHDWLERLPDFWLVGAGAGNKFNVCVDSGHCWTQAHNLYLQFFYEFGVGGALLLLIMIGCVLARSLNRDSWGSPLGSVGFPLIVFAVLTALFNYHTVMNRPGVYWLVFWMPVGLVLSMGSQLTRKRSEARPA